eukprot:scaffold12863_cov62-Attheya_sp.AAC.1
MSCYIGASADRHIVLVIPTPVTIRSSRSYIKKNLTYQLAANDMIIYHVQTSCFDSPFTILHNK